MNCVRIYEDYISGCPDEVLINALLLPLTEYIWEVTDNHGNVYHIPFTTNEYGIGTLEMSSLPDGFCNPYTAPFQVRVKLDASSCDYEKLIMLQHYDSLKIRIVGGNLEKSEIGCVVPDYFVPESTALQGTTATGNGTNTQTFPVLDGYELQFISMELQPLTKDMFNQSGTTVTILLPGTIFQGEVFLAYKRP